MNLKMMLMLSGSLAVAACGQKNDAANADMNLDGNVMIDNGMAMNDAATAVPLTAQAFANAAAASDAFEIESSKLAQASASSAAVKSFAAKMATDHDASTAKLKSILAGMSPAVIPDPTLNATQQAALTSLKGQTGAGFDSAYAAAQVDAHQKTLDALNGYAAGGDNAQLKAFAAGQVPAVAAHLNVAKGLK
ncbi:MAG: DUF4142 domain-containing protein [Sphingomicrobium sp.]